MSKHGTFAIELNQDQFDGLSSMLANGQPTWFSDDQGKLAQARVGTIIRFWFRLDPKSEKKMVTTEIIEMRVTDRKNFRIKKSLPKPEPSPRSVNYRGFRY